MSSIIDFIKDNKKILIISIVLIIIVKIHHDCCCEKDIKKDIKQYIKEKYETDPYLTPPHPLNSVDLVARIYRNGNVFTEKINGFKFQDGDRVAVISFDNVKWLRKTIEDIDSNRHYIATYINDLLKPQNLTLSRNYDDNKIYLKGEQADNSAYYNGYWVFVKSLN
jgi:hypothetical protein